MKDMILLTKKEEIHDFVLCMWKTDMFSESHSNLGFIWKIVEQFAFLPRIFAETTNDDIERSHFSTWWNVIMLRNDYTNPVIHDLYLAHELWHAGNMPYLPGIGKVAFDEKMQRNELEASSMSEIQIYFEMPGLRKQSFNHPIYADRFLNDPDMQALWKNNKTVAIETIRTIRRDVMLSKPEHMLDLTETWIRRFAEQNAIYSLTWSDRYNEVETHMAALQHNATVDRKAALKTHVDWLTAEAANDPVDNIPFRQEGELFAAFYRANKEKYSKAMQQA